jgi:hypothetical protein
MFEGEEGRKRRNRRQEIKFMMTYGYKTYI